MYFKESDRIANREKLPRSDIEKVDRFLAREHLRRFKLHDVWDKADIRENAQPILDEFIKLRVVKQDKRYFCPEDDNVLLPTRCERFTQKVHCIECEKTYPIHKLDNETIYERKKEPIRWSNSKDNNPSVQPEGSETLRRKVAKWILDRIAAPTLVQILVGISTTIIIGGIGGHLFNNNFLSQEPTQTPIPTLSRPTMTIQATPTSSVTATSIVSPTQRSELIITSEPTASIPPNPVITPSS